MCSEINYGVQNPSPESVLPSDAYVVLCDYINKNCTNAPLPQIYLPWCYSHLQSHKDQRFCFFCSDVTHKTIPLVLGTLIIISEVTSLPFVHLQSCMPATSRVTENKRTPKVDIRQKGACSARMLSFGFGSFFGHGRFLPHHCAYLAAPLIFLVACAKSAHNSTQRPLCIWELHYLENEYKNLIISLHRNLRLG